MSEIALLGHLNHPILVRFLLCVNRMIFLFIVTESLACRTLADSTNQRPKMPQAFVQSMGILMITCDFHGVNQWETAEKGSSFC
jgi:hypothetical protein